MNRYGLAIVGFCCLLSLVGCGRGSGSPKVTVYSALDREFSEPILNDSQSQIGVEVAAKFDVESSKTVALTNMIIAESERPRCDLFWNNEIVNTIRLKKRGLLRPFTLANQDDYPEAFRDKDRLWHGFAARARILLVNTQLVSEADRPKNLKDLADPRWKGRVGMAKPLFGTTATHAACLFAVWGDEKALAFFRSLKDNQVQVLSGNKQVAQAVGTGQIAFGLTDTDDALGEIAEGRPVVVVYPDQEPNGLGALLIPNTIALIKGSPHPQEAEKLAAWLFEPSVESRLASGPSGQIPLGAKAKGQDGALLKRLGLESWSQLVPMKVDFEVAADRFDEVARELAKVFVD